METEYVIVHKKSGFKRFILGFFKFIIWLIVTLLGLVFIYFIGANAFKPLVYKDFNRNTRDIIDIPDIHKGFIPQGLAFVDDRGENLEDYYFLMSGYLDKEPSRLYVVNYYTKSSYYVNLTVEGKLVNGHFGGLGYTNGYVYLTNENPTKEKSGSIYVVSFDSLLTKKNGESLEVKYYYNLEDNKASFASCTSNTLLVGEFYNKNFLTNDTHNFKLENGNTSNALMYELKINPEDGSLDLNPQKIVALPDEVQGIAYDYVNDKYYLSRSYGIASSKLSSHTLKETTNTYQNQTLYEFSFNNNESQELKVLPMLEGIDFTTSFDTENKGNIISINESASNKYIFGKFTFETKIKLIKTSDEWYK